MPAERRHRPAELAIAGFDWRFDWPFDWRFAIGPAPIRGVAQRAALCWLSVSPTSPRPSSVVWR